MRNEAEVAAQIQIACEQRTCLDTDDEIKVTFLLLSLFLLPLLTRADTTTEVLELKKDVSSWLNFNFP